MTRRRWLELALLALGATFLPGAGCGLFDTREPDTASGGNTVWTPPTSTEIVVQNLQLALEAAIFGDYNRAFLDDFVFVPDPSDVVQLSIERPGEPVYSGWTKDVETQTAENYRTTATSLDLQFTFLSEQVLPEGRLHKYDYTLTLTLPTAVEVYKGQAWFEIHQAPSGDWYIARWEDYITPSTVESWGRLKGRNRTL
jgi:hypothetical protein